MGGKKKYIEMFGSFTEPFIYLPNKDKRITTKWSVLEVHQRTSITINWPHHMRIVRILALPLD